MRTRGRAHVYRSGYGATKNFQLGALPPLPPARSMPPGSARPTGRAKALSRERHWPTPPQSPRPQNNTHTKKQERLTEGLWRRASPQKTLGRSTDKHRRKQNQERPSPNRGLDDSPSSFLAIPTSPARLASRRKQCCRRNGGGLSKNRWRGACRSGQARPRGLQPAVYSTTATAQPSCHLRFTLASWRTQP